ncbi:metal ABC transporter solute-binding protein, Zn/Mn family [Paenibacillus yanchengensis]|uniref:Metal ABC transporter solute-binding protein, Zn/Mn family n=1 Tax=Paenibacillus yanchengensis TaxID=2035833 RepID=A0ABW4YKR3_9BACL
MGNKHRFTRISKQKIAALLLALMMVSAACSNNDLSTVQPEATTTSTATTAEPVESEEQQAIDTLSVVTSFYPLYFLATEIGGEHVQVTNLIPTGVEPHDWAPKSKEVKKLTDAALFLYHGVGLEGWVDSFIRGLPQQSTVQIKQMSEGITLIDGDVSEGEADHGHDHGEDTGNSHTHAIDPHTWVSPKSVIQLAENVKNSLVEVDPAHQADYEKNYKVLQEKLQAMDQRYEEELGKVSKRHIVVSHQAFAYLARDYNLVQKSIMGLNPEAEPLAQDILRIAKFVKEENVQYIFFEELISDDLAQMLAAEAGAKTMVLHPLEGLTKKQEKEGENFLTLMERNLHNLTQALQ